MAFSLRVVVKSLLVHALVKVRAIPFHLRRTYYRAKYGPEGAWSAELARKVYLPTGLDPQVIKGIRIAGTINKICEVYGLPLDKSNMVRGFGAYSSNQNVDLLVDNVFGHFFRYECQRKEIFETMCDWDDLNPAFLPHKLSPDELAKFNAWLEETL